MENEEAVYEAYLRGFIVAATGSFVSFNTGKDSLPMTLKQHVAMAWGVSDARRENAQPRAQSHLSLFVEEWLKKPVAQPAASLESSGPGAEASAASSTTG